MIYRIMIETKMFTFLPLLVLILLGQGSSESIKNKTVIDDSKQAKALSVFNIVSFPNSACGATSGYNGTCYTASECTALSGTASGTCASSFGVCCVFSIACGASSSQNNSYAIINSYSVSSDSDPCTYTFCKANSDVCKLRIDFDTMVLADPEAISSTAAYTDGPKVGDCATDTLTVSNPGGSAPPIICGTNTGQHMFVPASDNCNKINIDIDTGSTGTTRKWQIKISQFKCGDAMSPGQDCLQYHTAQTGTVASFNWDMSSTTVSSSQYHLSNQDYNICIRRARKKCEICYTPKIYSITTGIASSYGVGSSSVAATQTASISVATCTGVTTQATSTSTGLGVGDFLEIGNSQAPPTTAGTVNANSRICGVLWNVASIAGTTQSTVCSFVKPFKILVHFDEDEAIHANPGTATANLDKGENDPLATTGAGFGYSGFWLTYFQNEC